MTPSDTRIAFFGGANNAAAVKGIVNLAQAGFDVVVADHDARESVALRAAGVAFTSDRMAAVAGRNVVITSLSAPADVEDLYLGDDGLVELMTPGSHAIDLSFSLPQLASEIYAMAAIADIEVLDAPLVNLGEQEGTVLFVGGTPQARGTLAPLFPYLASTVLEQQEPGEGQFAAVLAYIALAGSLMGAIEATAVAHVAEFPQNAAVNVLASTAGGSRALVDYVPRVLAHDYTGNLKVCDFLQALEVVLEAADDLDVTVPVMETAYQLYDLLSLVGGEELNIQALALLYEDEQTCADHGLNWELADAAEGYDDEDDDDADGGGFGFEDFFGPGPSGGPDGPDGPGGHRPYSSIFSRN